VQDLFGVLVDDPGQAALVQAESAAGAAQGTVDLGTGLLSDQAATVAVGGAAPTSVRAALAVAGSFRSAR
jgi:hypothetical protein